MKKYTLILILAGIALLIVVVLLITSLFLKNEPPSPPIIPSPNQNRLAVVSPQFKTVRQMFP